jgi:hypothetical protein
MSRRIFAALLTGFFLFQSLPLASAVDIPLLTWERGKEQNIVVGGISAKDPWEVKLLKPGSPQISFKPSSVNRRGFLVYSATLPQDLPLGNYTVYVFGDGSISGTQVGQVKVITFTRYSITEIPKDLVFLLLTIIFMLTVLSVSRIRKYSNLTFLRQKNLVESGTLLFDNRVPRFLYPAYVLRSRSLGMLPASLFKFLLMKDDTFIHKISPFLWALFPALGLVVGLEGGITTHGNLPNIALYSLIAISTIGLLDSYSGIFAFFGFAIGQIIIGEVMNLRSVVLIITLALSWIFTSFVAHYLVEIGEKDFPITSKESGSGFARFILLVFVSVISGVFFFASLILTESLALGLRNHHDSLVVTAIIIGTLSGVKALLHEFMDHRTTMGLKSDSLVSENLHVSYLISSGWVGFIGFFALVVGFVWTQSWFIALLLGILMIALFSSFQLLLKPPKINLLSRWKRNAFLEAAVVTYFALTLFLYVQNLPYQSSLKSEIFTIGALILPLIHLLANSFYNVATAEKVS